MRPETPRILEANGAYRRLAGPAPGFGEGSAATLAFDRIRPSAAGDFTLGVRLSAGRLAADQFLALDDVADRYGDGTLTLAPRQTIEIAGVLKRDLKDAIGELALARLTTLAGGDIAHVVTAAAPGKRGGSTRLDEAARRLRQHLPPLGRAYDAIWLDGEGGAESGADPLYGAADLPAPLSIGLTLPTHDAIDVLTHDVALVAVDNGDRLSGYHLALGGARGGTFRCLATPVAFIEPQDLLAAAAVAVRLFRDFGDRGDRSFHHLVTTRGAARTKAALDAALGKALAPPRPLPPLRAADLNGWREQGDGRLSFRLALADGHIADGPGARLRTALRLLCKGFAGELLLASRQEIILADIAPADRLAVETALAGLRVATADPPLALKEAS